MFRKYFIAGAIGLIAFISAQPAKTQAAATADVTVSGAVYTNIYGVPTVAPQSAGESYGPVRMIFV